MHDFNLVGKMIRNRNFCFPKLSIDLEKSSKFSSYLEFPPNDSRIILKFFLIYLCSCSILPLFIIYLR